MLKLDVANDDDTEHQESKQIDSVVSNSIQLVSDIHLEFPTTYEKMKQIRKKSSIIALLGDIGYPKHNSYKQFIKDMSLLFEFVIIIAGNHEYFTEEYYSVNDKIENIANQYDNVYFLNNQRLDLPNNILGDDIRILGTTLWTNYPDKNVTRLYSARISEFKVIDISDGYSKNKKNSKKNDKNDKNDDADKRLLTSVDLNKLYENNIKWLKQELKRAKSDKKRVIILTHHAPTDYLCVDPDLKQEISNKENRKLQTYYMQFVTNYSNCESLFQEPLIGWFFGHTHHNCDFYIKCTKNKNKNKNNNKGIKDWYVRVATNQQGYLLRSTRKTDDFSEAKVIAFDTNHLSSQNVDSNVQIIDYHELLSTVTNKKEIFDEMQKAVGKSQQTGGSNQNCCSNCCVML